MLMGGGSYRNLFVYLGGVDGWCRWVVAMSWLSECLGGGVVAEGGSGVVATVRG